LILLFLCFPLFHSAVCTCGPFPYCSQICTNNETITTSIQCYEEQLTVTDFQCKLILDDGDCNQPYGLSADLFPDNSFPSYTVYIPSTCSSVKNTHIDVSHNPSGYIRHPTIDSSVLIPITIAYLCVLFVALCCTLSIFLLCYNDYEDDAPDVAFGLIWCIALALCLSQLIAYSLFMSDCLSSKGVKTPLGNAYVTYVIAPTDYNFDIYTGPPLSIDDNYTSTDPNVETCIVSTTFDGEFYEQTCRCEMYKGPPRQYYWFGINRYHNCENYHQNTGCDPSTEYPVAFVAWIISCCNIGLFCCLLASCVTKGIDCDCCCCRGGDTEKENVLLSHISDR